ncbi:hypothetical protein AVEN_62924-1 [Araneus ventricosus]|uniref:Uncharacterized protein n=1 Tax=Araneus ventricosus TaxID=182803 RepID=A0A4Y2TDR2_ARAVE|nr:hypothetical protein AVEN_62924-1 [Araneus ventricosus]
MEAREFFLRQLVVRSLHSSHQVPRIHLVDYGTIRSQSSSLVSTVLGLRFHVQQHHLRQGELRLRCESTLAREILRRREEVIFEGRHETADLQVAQIAKSVPLEVIYGETGASIYGGTGTGGGTNQSVADEQWAIRPLAL